MSISRYGVREQVQSTTDTDVHVEEVRMLGCTVVESGFSAADLDNWKARLEGLATELASANGGSAALAEIGEANTVRSPLVLDPAFLDVARNKRVLAIARALLGEYFILNQQNGILNRPAADQHHQAAYHRDLPYQHFVSSRPIAINALLCLDPFEPVTGCTHALLGSHKAEAFPSDRYVVSMEKPISARPGCYIIMDSMLYHRAGVNRSNTSRLAVNNAYTLPMIKQQISLPAALKGRWRDDPECARFLGYETEPPGSVEEFYEQRRARLAKRPG